MSYFGCLYAILFLLMGASVLFIIISRRMDGNSQKSKTVFAMELAAKQGYSEAINTLYDSGIRYEGNEQLEASVYNFKLPYGFWQASPSIIATTLFTLSNRHYSALRYYESLAKLLCKLSRYDPRLMLSVTCEMACRDTNLFHQLIQFIPKN